MKILRNIVIAIVVIGIIAAGAFFAFGANRPSTTGQFQTEVARKGNLQARVGATGTVRANQSAILAWQTTGTVEEVKVKVGDKVKADDVLASLSKDSLPQSVILAEADLLNAERAIEDLKTSGLSKAEAELTLAQAEKALEDAENRYEGINFKRGSDTKVDNVKAQLDVMDDQISMARRMFAVLSKLPNSDSRRAQALANLTSLELQRDSLVAQLNYLTGKPTENDASQLAAKFSIAQAQLEEAKIRIERLKNGYDPVELATLQAKLTAARATLNTTSIQAPFAGELTIVEPLPGDQVSPGLSAFRLDDLSRLLVDVQVSEIDINSIAMDQTVTMTFDAILGKTYNGKVVEVGRVGNVVQGAVEFTVTVEITDTDEFVRPGMTAAVTIVVKELKDVLLVPNRAVRIVDGNRVVYILKDGLPTPVKVRLGSNSDSTSEVIGGDLKEGDTIILNPPQTGGGGGPGTRPGGSDN